MSGYMNEFLNLDTLCPCQNDSEKGAEGVGAKNQRIGKIEIWCLKSINEMIYIKTGIQ